MTHKIETAGDRTFSEPPVVSVSGTRTHCHACLEPLDPNVMHKCHGNQPYHPPVHSHTQITEKCPECSGEGALVEARVVYGNAFTIVCKACRTYVWPLVSDKCEAIKCWNAATRGTNQTEGWPKWLASLPGELEYWNNVGAQSATKPAHPDLGAYKGACPAVHVEGEVCDLCQGTGEVK